MSSSVKNLFITLNPVNGIETFTNGDVIAGNVVLEVLKETKIQTLSIKIKGKTSVSFSSGEDSYSDKERYYTRRRFFIADNSSRFNMLLLDSKGRPYSKVVGVGRHVYPFSFKLPEENTPPSFSGKHGKIVYNLETKLNRLMHLSKKVKLEFRYTPRDSLSNPVLMEPQSDTKVCKLLIRGKVYVEAATEKLGVHLGEVLKVFTKVKNNSTRTCKLVYCLYEQHSFFVGKRKTTEKKDLLAVTGKIIKPSTTQSVTHMLTIPPELIPSILNCKIINVEHKLRVSLDVPFSSGLKIKLPVVILPRVAATGTMVPQNRGQLVPSSLPLYQTDSQDPPPYCLHDPCARTQPNQTQF